MKFLLDSHAYLFWLTKPSRLSPAAREAIEAQVDTIYVSAITAFEIGFKFRLGKLPEAFAVASYTQAILQLEGFIELPISLENCELAAAFISPHRDPFDRMLAAQSIIGDLTLISSDTAMDQFGARRLW